MTAVGNGTRVGLSLAGAGAVAGFVWSNAEGRASIEWAWTFFSRIIETSPIEWSTVLLSMLAGWAVMLRFSMLPMRCMSAVAASLAGQIVGGIAAFVVVWFLWREPLGFIVGGIIALLTPVTWALALILLELCPGQWARAAAAELRGEGKSIRLFRRQTAMPEDG